MGHNNLTCKDPKCEWHGEPAELNLASQKLKVGDEVWLRVPVNGKITKVGRYGYTIFVEEQGSEDEIEKIKK